METKLCKKCDSTREITLFNKNRAKKDGLQPYCRDCTREGTRKHYKENKEYYGSKAREQKRVLREYVDSIKSSSPCKDCGVSYSPWVMDFDHRDPDTKVNNVTTLIEHGSMDKLKTEIDKCDLVCANCHRERTAKQRWGK